MLDDGAVLDLRAEQDDLGIDAHAHRMARRPIEEIAARDDFFLPIAVRDGDLPLDHVSPMRGLAQIGFQSLEERPEVGALLEREVLARDRAVTAGIAKVQFLSGDGAGHVQSGLDVVLCDAHVGSLCVGGCITNE